jgi:hypothetical protein
MDLIENTLTSLEKYHKWIDKTQKLIFPKKENYKLSVQDDINLNPFKYTKYMLIINKELQKNGKKQFQSIPVRTQINDKYVQIDTKAVEDIFTEVNSEIDTNELWKKHFNLNKFKIKGYTFNNLIATDGYSVAINFINNLQIPNKIKKHDAMSSASKKSKNEFKNKTPDEINKIKNCKKEKQKEKNKENQMKRNETKKKLKEDFKKKSKEEQEQIILEIKLRNNEFEYIEDAVKNEKLFQELKKAYDEERMVFIDPGCRSPMTMLGFKKHVNDEKINKITSEIIKIYDEYKKRCGEFEINTDKTIKIDFQTEAQTKIKYLNKKMLDKCQKKGDNKILYNYSNRKRMKETKRLKILKLIDNKKKKTKINNKSVKELEAELSKNSGKTTNFKEFEKFAKIKIKMKLNVNKEYSEYINKLKMNAYTNLRRHEDKLLDELEKIFGKNAIMIIGNWSKQKGIKYISTPNMQMKRLLSKRFKVFLIDEYKTSMIYHKTDEQIYESKDENKIKFTFKTKDKKEIKKTIHAILTFKMSNKRSECINRDYNATLNMLAIVKHLLETKKRPKCFIYEKPLQPVKGSSVKKL